MYVNRFYRKTYKRMNKRFYLKGRIDYMKTILGIKVSNRLDEVDRMQDVLTKQGCIIKTRLGLHEQQGNSCSKEGIILLELNNDTDGKCQELENTLQAIEGLEVNKMTFS